MIAVDSEEVGACRRSRPDKRQTRMEADGLEVPWVVGLARTGEGGVRERVAVAVPKPREEGIGRGGPAWLVLRERGGGGPVHMARRKGPAIGRAPTARSRGRAGCVDRGCCGLGPIGKVWFLN
jgi:hypothetical protein